MKGIKPVCLKHLIVAQSYLIISFALTVTPNVDLVPSISMFSLTEVGIP